MTKLGSGPDHFQSGQAGKRADFLCREGDFVGAQRNSDSPGLFQKPTRANPIYGDVEGATFRIGERLRIVGSKDETFDTSYKGRVGSVEYFEYQCGCGQTYPDDPMIGVRFHDDAVEEFWAEELIRSLKRRKQGPRSPATFKKGADCIRRSYK